MVISVNCGHTAGRGDQFSGAPVGGEIVVILWAGHWREGSDDLGVFKADKIQVEEVQRGVLVKALPILCGRQLLGVPVHNLSI